MNNIEKGYIAGTLDGEGTIRIIKNKKLSVQLEILSNTEKKYINKIIKILKSNQIPYYLYKFNYKYKTFTPLCYKIIVSNQLHVKKIIEDIKDHCAGKKQRLELALNIINEKDIEMNLTSFLKINKRGKT